VTFVPTFYVSPKLKIDKGTRDFPGRNSSQQMQILPLYNQKVPIRRDKDGNLTLFVPKKFLLPAVLYTCGNPKKFF
jgi:hypothetical protein